VSDFGVGPPPEFPPLLIDVRSPGERAFDHGRDVVSRVNALIETQRFDVAALVWLFFIFTITVAEIYRALFLAAVEGLPSSDQWWTKLQLLTQSGGTILIFGCLFGIVFALLHPGPLARLALWLCAIGGVWATVTGCIGVAVAFHDPVGSNADGNAFSVAQSFGEKAVQGALYLGFAGMGLVLAAIAWRVAIVRGSRLSAAPEDRDDEDLVELS
jgi:hypothetical protein